VNIKGRYIVKNKKCVKQKRTRLRREINFISVFHKQFLITKTKSLTTVLKLKKCERATFKTLFKAIEKCFTNESTKRKNGKHFFYD